MQPLEVDPIVLLQVLIQYLTEAAEQGASDMSALLGLEFDRAPPEALEWARSHAAELVGMRRLPNGVLIPNPRPEWQITDTIRRAIQAKVDRAIQKGWSPGRLSRELRRDLGKSRARMIARTELLKAYNIGSLRALAKAGFTYTKVLDGKGCLPIGHDDKAPKPSGRPGVVEFNAQANGQIWTLDQAEQLLGGHPNCRRTLIGSTGLPLVEAA